MGKYLTPPTTDHTTKCLIIFYPEDDQFLFRQALLGQITKLERFWMWEGEREYTEEIEQVWRDHNYLTQQSWDELDCELVPIILGDEDMNINLTTSSQSCGCGCGCGCGGGNTIIGLEPPEGSPYPEPTEPGGTPATGDDLCDRATEIAYRFVDVYQKLRTWFAGIGVTAQGIEALLTAVFGQAGTSVIYVAPWILSLMATAFSVVVANNITEQAYDAAQAIQNDLMCAIRGSTSPSNARTRWLAVISEVREDWGNAIYVMFYFTTMLIDFTKVVEEGHVPVSPEFVGSTCNCLGEDIAEELALAPGYWLVPVIAMDSIVSVNSGNMVHVFGNEWEVTGLANAGADWVPDLSPFGYDWSKDAGTHAFGYQYEVLSIAGGNVQFGVQSTAGTMHNAVADVPAGVVYRSGSSQLNNWIVGADQLIDAKNVGTAIPLGGALAGEFLQWGGTGDEMTVRVKLWCVVDETGTATEE